MWRRFPPFCNPTGRYWKDAPCWSTEPNDDGRGDAWIERIRGPYLECGRRVAARLGLEPPAGSTFLFPDVADRLDERGLLGLLEDCADRGLFLAPGPSFGPYPTHVRICFTCAPPEVVERGAGILAELLGR